MTAFDFDTPVDRRGSGSLKWDVPEGELPMWVADMDFKTAPAVRDALAGRLAHGVFGYSVVPDEWYSAYCDWWRERHGVTFDPAWLTFATGVVPALSSIVRKLTTVGENVLIMTPVYNIFFNSIVNNGRHVLESPLRYEGGVYDIDFADLERKLADPETSMLILCNPHNPAGRVFTLEELSTLAAICLQHHVLIVADEIHHDFVRPGFQHTTLASLSSDIAQHTITCTAPSKTFNLAGLQCSNIFIENPVLRQKFRRTIDRAGYSQPNALGLFAAQAAYENGLPWLNELRAYLEQNYARTKAFLAREMPRVRLIEPEGTYLLWLDFRAYGLSAHELDDIIVHKARLWLDSGHIFGADGDGFERLNIACPWQTLARGLTQLAAAFRDLPAAEQ